MSTATIFGHRELRLATGLAERQVDYWTRAGVLVPVGGNAHPGSGANRYFDEEEVLIGRLLKRVLDVGIGGRPHGTGRDLIVNLVDYVRSCGASGEYVLAPGVHLDLAALTSDASDAAVGE